MCPIYNLSKKQRLSLDGIMLARDMETTDVLLLLAIIVSLSIGLVTLIQTKRIQKSQYRHGLLKEISDWAIDVDRWRTENRHIYTKVVDVGDDQQGQRQLRHAHIVEVIEYLAAKRARNHYICVLAQRFDKSLQKTVDMLTKKLQGYEDFLEQWRKAVFTACEQGVDEDPQYIEDADNHASQLAEYTKKVIENVATTEAKVCG